MAKVSVGAEPGPPRPRILTQDSEPQNLTVFGGRIFAEGTQFK